MNKIPTCLLIIFLSFISINICHSEENNNPFDNIRNLFVVVGDKSSGRMAIDNDPEIIRIANNKLTTGNISTIADLTDFRKNKPNEPYGLFIISKSSIESDSDKNIVYLSVVISVNANGTTVFGGNGNMGIFTDSFLYRCKKEEINSKLSDSIDSAITSIINYKTNREQ
jgi:hypothetical protein